MLGDLTPAQLALAEYMSELSEEAYCAGWMKGLEYVLWQVILGQRADFGRLTFTPEHAKVLRTLSDACGGWIVFDDEWEETWIARTEWDKRFSVWLATGGPARLGGL